MSGLESKVLAAVLKNNDIHRIMGEPQELFGPYGDVIDSVKDYYAKYKSVPPESELRVKFPDVELPEVHSPTDYYLDELKSHFVKINTDALLNKIATALDNGNAPSEVVEKALTAFTRLTKYTSGTTDLNVKDYEMAMDHYNTEREKSNLEGVSGIPTGIEAMDANYPTGFAPGQSIVVMGYSASGKSWFTALLAVKAWSQGRRVMVVSLELTPEEYRDRLYSVMSSGQFRGSDLIRGQIDEDEFLEWARDKLYNSSDFVIVSTDVSKPMTPNSIQAKIDTHKPNLVILDYIQLMTDNDDTPSMTPRMLNLSRQVKLMAMSNRIPIISITSVTDEEGAKREGPPRISQIAWSRGIEFDSSLVLSVYKHGENIIEVVSRKNRYGSDFSFFFEVDFDRGIWTEMYETPEGLKSESK